MRLILIAALSKNRVIGKDGVVPWDIPVDVQRFKRLTTGHALLMGRKTYEALGTPLPDRRNVVLASHEIPGAETYQTLAGALEALKNEEDVYVIGGGEVFAQLLTSAAELRLTLVDRIVEGDAYFPPYEHLIGSFFKLASEEHHDGFSFVDYVQVR
jgi:dihydrofolate reductase